LLITNWK